MKKTMINDSPRQHVVQKRLLSNFSSTPNAPYNEQKIWTYNKATNESKEVPISQTGILKSFLAKDADANITNIESECFPIIRRITEKRCIYCRRFTEIEGMQNGLFLYRYIGAQLNRTMKFRRELKQIPFFIHSDKISIKETQSDQFRNKPELLLFQDLRFGRVSDEKKGFLANLYFSIIPRISKIPLLPFDSMSGSIFDISVPVVLINKTKIPFIQNDIGLLPFYPLNDTTYNINIFTGENVSLVGILLFPITPSMSICLCTTKSVSEWSKQVIEGSDRGLLFETQSEQTITQSNGSICIIHQWVTGL